LKDRFVGVNKVGKNALASLQKVEKQFASDSATFIFPAGLVSRKKKGRIEDLEWKKTFVSKAKKYGKPVVPVHINGRLTDRFYRLANVRKMLGIKLNIEMFFLVDELYKQKNATIDIVVGDPVKPGVFTTDKLDREWAQWMKKKVYGLKKA
ncbi:MAG: glycerol acyltransferase, partial [Cytophagales bacterium]|nr:glycerol acyltransferase [Cytophagales bacterium]